MESLHAHINPKYLPKRYGGIRPNYRYNRWIEKIGGNPRLMAGECAQSFSELFVFKCRMFIILGAAKKCAQYIICKAFSLPGKVRTKYFIFLMRYNFDFLFQAGFLILNNSFDCISNRSS